MSKSQARAASRQTQSRATKRSSPLSVPARAAKAVGAKLVGSKSVGAKPSAVKSSSRSALATAKRPSKVTRPASAVPSRDSVRAPQPAPRAGRAAVPASPSRGAIAPSRVIEVAAPVQAPSAPDGDRKSVV